MNTVHTINIKDLNGQKRTLQICVGDIADMRIELVSTHKLVIPTPRRISFGQIETARITTKHVGFKCVLNIIMNNIPNIFLHSVQKAI